jgi:hypothetical protein
MKRLLRWLIRLYPRAWRERYGNEFEALIEDSPPRWRMIFDLLKGAFTMQFAMPNMARVLAVMTIAGLAAGFGISYAVKPRYESHAQLVFSSTSSQPSDLVIAFLHYRDEIMSRLQLSRIIQDPGLSLYADEVRTSPIEDVIDTMRSDLKFEMTNATARALQFRVSFAFSDAEKAQKTVQAVYTRLEELLRINQENAPAGEAAPRDKEIARLEARIDELERPCPARKRPTSCRVPSSRLRQRCPTPAPVFAFPARCGTCRRIPTSGSISWKHRRFRPTRSIQIGCSSPPGAAGRVSSCPC